MGVCIQKIIANKKEKPLKGEFLHMVVANYSQ